MELEIKTLNKRLNDERQIRERVQSEIALALSQVGELVGAINQLYLDDFESFDTCDGSIQTDDQDFEIQQFHETRKIKLLETIGMAIIL